MGSHFHLWNVSWIVLLISAFCTNALKSTPQSATRINVDNASALPTTEKQFFAVGPKLPPVNTHPRLIASETDFSRLKQTVVTVRIQMQCAAKIHVPFEWLACVSLGFHVHVYINRIRMQGECMLRHTLSQTRLFRTDRMRLTPQNSMLGYFWINGWTRMFACGFCSSLGLHRAPLLQMSIWSIRTRLSRLNRLYWTSGSCTIAYLHQLALNEHKKIKCCPCIQLLWVAK